MIFKKELLEKILSGEKIQTRRPVSGSRFSFKPGRIYAVQPSRFDSAVAYILITGVRREYLGQICNTDIHKEGFKNIKEFRSFWRNSYDRWHPRRLVWVLDFRLISGWQ